jgi:hypothetical protein
MLVDNIRAYNVALPAPIPAALPLFGQGITLMGLFGWRRKDASQFVSVNGKSSPAIDFQIERKPALEVLNGNYYQGFADDLERSEYFVPINWASTFSIDQAI